MRRENKIYRIIGLSAVTFVGYLVIPALMKKYANKMYKNSLKKDVIDFENMEPEIVKKKKIKED